MSKKMLIMLLQQQYCKQEFTTFDKKRKMKREI
jgi:hypothetical protein